LFKVPVVIAAIMAGFWFIALRGHARPILTGVAGIGLGWGLALHLGDDMTASRRLRAANQRATEELGAVVPDYSALITYWGSRDAAGPLLFDRDVVILDARADAGADAPTLIRELLARQRRVFVDRRRFPHEVLARVLAGWVVVPLPQADAGPLLGTDVVLLPATDVVELQAEPARALRP
jgi:hypothetical protein